MQPRINLTDRKLAAFRARPGERPELMDTASPGLGVRVSETGTRTFFLRARFPGSANPVRRSLGTYPAMPLAEARAKAAEWRVMLKRGIDPRDEEQRQRAKEEQKRANTFAAVFEDFAREKLPSERRGWQAERDMRNHVLPRWGTRPVTEIGPLDAIALVKAKRATPAMAQRLATLGGRFFAWAVEQQVYDLRSSPLAGLRLTRLIGGQRPRDRVLSDDELRALWRVADRMGYPFGCIYKMLILTGLRLNEVADASWREVDLRAGTWTIPASRMKGQNHRARQHIVPITKEILRILESLPRFGTGDFLFSASFGANPVWMSVDVKRRTDKHMLRTLRAMARHRGDDSSRVELPHWVNHDIRRTVRSRLSRLRITEEAREAVLAHVRSGVKGIYDHYDYLPEKREALELWASRLRDVVAPAPMNVVKMTGVKLQAARA